MKGIIDKIKNTYDQLSKIEQKIADVIVNNTEDSLFQSIYDIAEKAEVSVSSVSRFVKILGFDSFKQFKVTLARETTYKSQFIFKEIFNHDSKDLVVNKIMNSEAISIEETLRTVNIQTIVEIVEKILSANRIMFFGVGASGYICKIASAIFSNLDINAYAFNEPTLIIGNALRLKEKDVAIGITHSGRSMLTCKALEIAKENNACTVGITNYLKSPLAHVSRYLLCTSYPETQVKVYALSSRVSQLALIHALYILTAIEKKDDWDVEKLNTYTEDLLRYKKT
jgi:DNA-binding MurR/RpiR family transcriptional regulator